MRLKLAAYCWAAITSCCSWALSRINCCTWVANTRLSLVSSCDFKKRSIKGPSLSFYKTPLAMRCTAASIAAGGNPGMATLPDSTTVLGVKVMRRSGAGGGEVNPEDVGLAVLGIEGVLAKGTVGTSG